jgi:radical SAM superfamily enzyme YgiQ (UPF0313 family)
MRVLLGNLPAGGYPEVPPYGLLCLGAYLLREGHETYLIDLPELDQWCKALDTLKPNAVGLTTLTCIVKDAYSYAQEAKKRGIYTLMGGSHVTALPEEAIKYCDAVVRGEGEITTAELLKNPRSGIFEGELVKDLSTLPLPAYESVDMNFYSTVRRHIYNSILAYVFPEDRVGVYMTSRGCPYRCIYCHNSKEKSPLRFIDPSRVVDHLEEIIGRYKLDSIMFLDDEFLINKARVKKLCEEINNRNLKFYWSACVRVTDIEPDILEVIKSAGCVQLAFGFESGNNRILEVLKKQATVEDAHNAIEICQKAGMIVQGNFMFGNPTETEEEMIDTLRFAETHLIDGGIGAAKTTPLPGTTLWDWCEENKKLPPLESIDWNNFHYGVRSINMSNMDSGRFDGFMRIVGERLAGSIKIAEPMRVKKVMDWKKANLGGDKNVN